MTATTTAFDKMAMSLSILTFCLFDRGYRPSMLQVIIVLASRGLPLSTCDNAGRELLAAPMVGASPSAAGVVTSCSRSSPASSRGSVLKKSRFEDPDLLQPLQHRIRVFPYLLGFFVESEGNSLYHEAHFHYSLDFLGVLCLQAVMLLAIALMLVVSLP